jgi:hypothetical protein
MKECEIVLVWIEQHFLALALGEWVPGDLEGQEFL